MVNLYIALCWHTCVHESRWVCTVEFTSKNTLLQEDTHWPCCCWKVHQILTQFKALLEYSKWAVDGQLTHFITSDSAFYSHSFLPVTVWIYSTAHKGSTLKKKCPVTISLLMLFALVHKYKSTNPFSVLFLHCAFHTLLQFPCITCVFLCYVYVVIFSYFCSSNLNPFVAAAYSCPLLAGEQWCKQIFIFRILTGSCFCVLR